MAYVRKYLLFTFEGSTFHVEFADYGSQRGGQPHRYSTFVHVRKEGVMDLVVKGDKGRYKHILPGDPQIVDAEGNVWHFLQARLCGFSAHMTTPTASFTITVDYRGKRPAVVSIVHSGESLLSVPLTDIEEQAFAIARNGHNFQVIQS